MEEDWLLRLQLKNFGNVEEEKANSANYWSEQECQGFTYENYSLFHIVLIGRLVSYLGYKNIVEIGCGSGRNLKVLNSVPSLEFDLLRGYDFNKKFIDYGRDKFKVDVRCEDILESRFDLDNRSDSACFSISVLDHIVNVDDLVEGLTKSFGLIVLLEPSVVNDSGMDTAKLISTKINSRETESQPYTYVHNYKKLFSRNGFENIVDSPVWPSSWGSGSAYRLMAFSDKGIIGGSEINEAFMLMLNQSVIDERAAWRKLINITSRKSKVNLEKAGQQEDVLRKELEELNQKFTVTSRENEVLYKLVKRLHSR